MPHEADWPGDRDRFQHMLEAVEDALHFVQGRKREDLDNDRLLLRGLIQSIQVIGEAAARVAETNRQRVDLPWGKIVGMRHVLVHAYFKVDTDVIWRVVTHRLPEMAAKLKAALAAWPE